MRKKHTVSYNSQNDHI